MSQQASGGGQSVYYAGLAGVVLIIIAALWFLFKGPAEPTETVTLPPVLLPQPEQVAAVEQAEQMQPEAVNEPAVMPEPITTIETPVAEVKPELPPLPPLNVSDKVISDDLLALNWKAGMASLFNREDMVRHFVVTVDNLAQGRLVAGHAVLSAPADAFLVEQVAPDRFRMAAANAARYEPYIQLLESVPARQLLALKARYQPLLDEAFAELGYPDMSFEQRLRQTINLLLATPELSSQPELIRPSVMYIYADPQLEALPEAQKQLLRLSPAQQRRLKAVLQTYQQALGN
ncbi:DUF3014 domain-containing protein [Rheinheimera sp. UJ51]|uniref:DUF3014 domain-containing protein n=1 Tax=Rheinheimera sp. UJ51 TaxID=2892446 RepID=UPI001E569661|nr:DUF3014 domain-containing protein [Rheinheimera sp. UJ51]MCC5451592.1 DUF3014 domain-containing protein [Rheinheimera sp. UJ51]